MTNLKAVPAACNAPHRAALEAVRVELKTRFFERNDIVDGVLAALLCRQHVFPHPSCLELIQHGVYSLPP
ncbi:MAG: hypothetical protein AAB654_06240 [Acidobacteriota bacterium]